MKPNIMIDIDSLLKWKNRNNITKDKSITCAKDIDHLLIRTKKVLKCLDCTIITTRRESGIL